jgi:glycosidase
LNLIAQSNVQGDKIPVGGIRSRIKKYMTVPYWVKDAIFYQIFPDRFRNGDLSNDPPNVQAWETEPNLWGFQGGDLRGVIEKIDYLLDLGINAIYMNPIFQATSNHRYNTSDYFKIDPKLGSEKDFKALLDVAHQNGIRIVIDGVFNHCGRGFFAFNDVLENHSHSPYIDWFHLNNVPPDAYSPGDADDYLAWWNFKSLPKFNTDNPAVREFIFDVARYWIRLGADGWRLDVPNEIDDEDFWEEFRQVVKTENPDAYLVGEIWDGDPRWVGEKSFDGLMNYPIRDGILNLLNGALKIDEFSKVLADQLSRYHQDNVYAMYNLLGSHDTPRIKTELNNHPDKMKLAFAFLFALPGAPAIYYGDEIGLEGEKDPDCRKAFPWNSTKWDIEFRSFIKKIIAIRKTRLEFRRGTFQEIQLDKSTSGISFARILGEESSLILMNFAETTNNYRLQVPELGWKDGRIVQDQFSGKEMVVSGTEIQVRADPWQFMWLNG